MVLIKRSNKKVFKKPVAKTTLAKPGLKKKISGFDRKLADSRAKTGTARSGFTGVKGFGQAKVEKQKSDENRRRRNLPWRMWIKPGDEAEVILLDEEPFFMYEHDLGKDAQGNKVFERCIKETGYCPLCSKTNREGYYVMMCTALDKRGYTPKPGSTAKPQKVVKRLYPVKHSQIPKFERFINKNGGSFRGVHLKCFRDGEKDSVIGSDIEYVGVVKEQVLLKYGADLTKVVNYEEAFPMLSEDEMKKKYGVKGPIGGSDFSKDEDADEEDAADAASGWDD